jgi:hypothetical protein
VKDADIMQRADSELSEIDDGELTGDARAKADAIGELGELVRGHVEMTADAVPDKRFDAMWLEIDKAIDRETERKSATQPAAAPAGFWRRLGRWFDHHRGHLITGAVSAGAVAALALILRPGTTADAPIAAGQHAPSPIVPAVYRPTEIQDLDTPGGTSSIWDVNDEDGSTTVIWVTPNDTVEGI